MWRGASLGPGFILLLVSRHIYREVESEKSIFVTHILLQFIRRYEVQLLFC